MMRGFLGAFAGYDAIVAPSSSCVGTVRHQFPTLADEAGDPGLTRDVEEVSPRIYDLSEFLIDRLGVEDVGAYFPHTVTYHSTCHSRRGIVLGRPSVPAAPRRPRTHPDRPAELRRSAAASGARSR